MIYSATYKSPIGNIVIQCDGSSILSVEFAEKTAVNESVSFLTEHRLLTLTKKWLDIYFSGEKPDFIPPLKVETTEFRQTVYELLLKIPYGKTMSYSEIAGIIAEERGIKRMSAQAVGGAVGKNPIAIIIPCHRVVGSNNQLVGYAGGLDKKKYLLNLEKGK